MKCWIYEIRDRDTGFFKIGRAQDPEKRFRQLVKQDTLLPRANDFELVNAWYGTNEDETSLHRLLAGFRIRGEWFSLETDKPINDFFLDHRQLYGDLTLRAERQFLIENALLSIGSIDTCVASETYLF